jgi:cytosine/adenosine deaminase-related metal-dependent hydrolase
LDILSTDWVVPVTAPPIADGAVAVAGGRVAWVGPRAAPGMPEGTPRDLGAGILLPGLVNAHCHLELSYLRGLWRETQGFMSWVSSLIARRTESDAERVRVAVSEALREAECTGTGVMGDITNRAEHVDLLGASGLRGVVLLEIVSWDPARSASTLAEWRSRREVVASAAAACGASWQVRLAAHAPHSVSAPVLRSLAEAGELASMHVAESPEEASFVRDGGGEWQAFLDERGLGHVAWTGARGSVVTYLDSVGALARAMMAVHCVQVSAADANVLARRGVHPVLCPRSNRNLGVGLAPLPTLLEAGLSPALGTDSLASVDDLDLGAEMALLRETFPEVSGTTLLEMATINGARALGLDDHGTITIGHPAVLAFAPTAGRVPDPVEALVCRQARPRLLRELV